MIERLTEEEKVKAMESLLFLNEKGTVRQRIVLAQMDLRSEDVF